MTYKQLLLELQKLEPEQLACDVTIELEYAEECFPAELCICGPEHFCLDEGHPVIFTTEA